MILFGHDLYLSWPLGLAVYFTFWWVSLFAILPLGVKSLHETDDATPGAEPGAHVGLDQVGVACGHRDLRFDPGRREGTAQG